jgi:hypothetical protein
MKSKTLLAGTAFCLLFFTNCNEKTAEGNATEGQTASVQLAPSDLVGYWVNDAWWKEVQSTKSPKKAAANLKGIAGAIVLQNGEQTTANLSYNWHEGMQYAIRTREGKQELFDPNNAATGTLPLTPLADGAVKFDSSALVRLAPTIEGAKAVGNAVLGGEYDLKGQKVVFNPNGTVAGLEGYNYYDLLLDYVVDEVGTDQLSFSKDGSDPKFYAFKWEGDHLIISEIDDVGGKDQFLYKVGKLRYDLVKK